MRLSYKAWSGPSVVILSLHIGHCTFRTTINRVARLSESFSCNPRVLIGFQTDSSQTAAIQIQNLSRADGISVRIKDCSIPAQVSLFALYGFGNLLGLIFV